MSFSSPETANAPSAAVLPEQQSQLAGCRGRFHVPMGTAHVPSVSQDPNQTENIGNGRVLPFRPLLPAAHRPHLCRATGGDVGWIKAPLHPPGNTRGGRGSVTCRASQELEQMVQGGAQVKDRAQWGWGQAAPGAWCKRQGRAGVQHPELCCWMEGHGGGGSMHPKASSQPPFHRQRHREPSHLPSQPGPCPVPSEGALRSAPCCRAALGSSRRTDSCPAGPELQRGLRAGGRLARLLAAPQRRPFLRGRAGAE